MTTPSANPPPEFAKLDPATPEFWNVRFDANFTPWDQRGVPQSLRDYLLTHPQPQKVLIPGCGTANEVKHFLACKWAPTAIDFSPAAVAQARTQLGPLASNVREDDFFGDAIRPGDFDVVYERAFLCALPRRLWADWAARVAELIPSADELSESGRLIGFFVEDENPKGPPFGLKPGELEQLLSPAFTLLEKKVPPDSIPVFAGKESWQVWARK
jgi:Thiopurine S-methyltransferase (TPMT)